jgi:hypothetical protein
MDNLDTASALDNTSLCIGFNLGNGTFASKSIKTNIVLSNCLRCVTIKTWLLASIMQRDNDRTISKPGNILSYYPVKA